MIKDVTFERTIYNPIPNKCEAGTGSIADAVGLGAALKYLSEIGMPCVYRWEHELLTYAMKEMKTVKVMFPLNLTSKVFSHSVAISGAWM